MFDIYMHLSDQALATVSIVVPRWATGLDRSLIPWTITTVELIL